jgi:hypothetical protein
MCCAHPALRRGQLPGTHREVRLPNQIVWIACGEPLCNLKPVILPSSAVYAKFWRRFRLHVINPYNSASGLCDFKGEQGVAGELR